MNMASSVQVKEITLITPSEPTPTQILNLSALDSQLFLRFPIEYLLTYEPCHGSDKSTTVAQIKLALARALVPYYPLAGRVRVRQHGYGLEVVCQAQGVVFIEAESNVDISDFEVVPLYVTERRKMLSLHVVDVLKGDPLLVVQLTWLVDGAVALGVGFSHCMCDGVGSVGFLNSFAEFARLGKSSANPVWDRHLLDSSHYGSHSVGHPEFNRVTDFCGFMSRFSHEKLTPTSATFNKISLSELKSVALTSQPSELPYTSFEVLSAHIWRSWAKALNFPPNQILKLLFSINIRERVQPSLPAEFYGNAIVLGCAQTSAKNLTDKSLSYVAELVRQAKARVGNKYVREVIELVSQTRACPDSVGVLIMSQWSRLGLEKVDFGMGPPVQVGPICSDRYCLLLPVQNQTDAVKVMLAVPTYGVDKYNSLLLKNNKSCC
ncbi:Taxadien-5-alpha-ol O-acetyltransferase [Heracleum sosnowskyi]|uniref:Taxadien-5-alpha-ol O-acetyltransferase n=1 Tax=Heracleum sosnowskyi TaxID=360622 RepID=A0AAD8GVR6_9APIA|nr:Taxadien-5-alpha-ol O-acetyltransferase [Heracleum sosnowskyi]